MKKIDTTVTYKLQSNLAKIFELRRYRMPNGHVPISEWFTGLNNITAGRIMAYIDRMKIGNFGNSKIIGQGVLELKINFGPGYRVYYLRDGESIVILLNGGDKDSQRKDINQAWLYAQDYWSNK